MKINFTINNESVAVQAAESEPLLWIIRDKLDMKGTKFGCGKAACGACTVHVDGQAVRSCSYPAELVEGKNITTIEGLGSEGNLHFVQQAWMEEGVPQCGYCQPGFMMATAAMLKNTPNPTDQDIDDQIANICRCGTYYRMRKAIYRAAELTNQTS